MKVNRKAVETALFGGIWLFGPMDMEQERWGRMMFVRNGRTFGYDHPNEEGWDFFKGSFRLLRKDGEPTSIFEEAVSENGRMLLKGRSIENPDSLYCLEQVGLTED